MKDDIKEIKEIFEQEHISCMSLGGKRIFDEDTIEDLNITIDESDTLLKKYHEGQDSDVFRCWDKEIANFVSRTIIKDLKELRESN